MNADDYEPIAVRPVVGSDRDAVVNLIEPYIQEKILLARTSAELHELLDSGFVAECGGEVIGFAALEVYSPKLAEIRSLAVDARFQGQGVGRQLVAECVAEASRREVMEVMAISSSEVFFRSCGFDFTLPGEKKAFFFSTRERT